MFYTRNCLHNFSILSIIWLLLLYITLNHTSCGCFSYLLILNLFHFRKFYLIITWIISILNQIPLSNSYIFVYHNLVILGVDLWQYFIHQLNVQPIKSFIITHLACSIINVYFDTVWIRFCNWFLAFIIRWYCWKILTNNIFYRSISNFYSLIY